MQAILQFFLALVLFAVIYILPLIGLVFTDSNHKRWLGHWMVTVFMYNIAVPALNFILPKWIVQLTVISLGAYRLLKFRNQKSLALFGKVDVMVQKATGFIELGKQKLEETINQVLV